MSKLKKHKEDKHEGIRYPCDQCEYSATQISNLKIHKKTKHGGIRYPCDQCDLVCASKQTLKRHKESKHEGIRYPCDQCEYSATRISYLMKHREAKHEGFRYPYDVSDIYQDNLEHVQEPELIEISKIYEKDKEIKTELDLDPLSIINFDYSENNTITVDIIKRTNVNSDCETKMEIVEDFVLKTEPSDIPEFNDQ